MFHLSSRYLLFGRMVDLLELLSGQLFLIGKLQLFHLSSGILFLVKCGILFQLSGRKLLIG